MLALRQGEAPWHGRHFVCGARGSMDGLLGRMCNVGTRVPKSDYIRGARGISGAHRGGQMVQHEAADSWDRMAEPGAVAIGGKRGGVAVVVEVDETLLNKAKRTQMRVAGRPQQRWLWGTLGGGRMMRISHFAYWGGRMVRLTAALEE